MTPTVLPPASHWIYLGYFPEDVSTGYCQNCDVYWKGNYSAVMNLIEDHLDASS